MIVDIEEEKSPSGTFELKGGGNVSLRLLTGKDLKEMRKACFSVTVEYPLLDGKYIRFEGPHFDEEKYDAMRWDRAITGWEGIADQNKKPVPVTPENKVLLMSEIGGLKDGKSVMVPRNPDFFNAVHEGLIKLRDDEKNQAERAEKN